MSVRKSGRKCVKPGGTAGSNYSLLSQHSMGQERYLLSFHKKEEYIMSTQEIPYKIYLEESEMPKAWYNVRADTSTQSHYQKAHDSGGDV